MRWNGSRAVVRGWKLVCAGLLLAGGIGSTVVVAQEPPAEAKAALESQLAELQKKVAAIQESDPNPFLLADVAVHAKAVEWCLRHAEFYKPEYADRAATVLTAGLDRAEKLAAGASPWAEVKSNKVVRGYISELDGSYQPYVVSVPADYNRRRAAPWPVHVHLHGRGDQLNEVAFIAQHADKPGEKDQTWIQLDVFGRTNNAYRWAGEVDVFEALAALRKNYRIDTRRIVLRGFSMGGAGSWHLGLHYPSQWCAVGPGAGFVDFYKYQKATPLPAVQHATLRIYDAIDYIPNAFNVPICTYGGELDEQLVASTSMVAAAKELGLEIPLVLGKGVGHKFTPEGYQEYLGILNRHMEKGRVAYPGRTQVNFTTYTVKYNKCEWASIEELETAYEPATVVGDLNGEGVLVVNTKNVGAIQIARDIADEILLNGVRMPLSSAAQGLLPGVIYEQAAGEWRVLSYESSLNFTKNLDGRKRHNLQGPIDDAFMQPFVCVRPTGKPLNEKHAAWAAWSLARFEQEWDKWFRGKLPVIDDVAVTDEMLGQKGLILFGDPGSNAVIKRLLPQLPLKWTAADFTIGGTTYASDDHALSLIRPNPLAPRQYVVINSGHTFHEKDFRASNAWLFPRLGDAAVQKYAAGADGAFTEETVWSANYDDGWRLPSDRK